MTAMIEARNLRVEYETFDGVCKAVNDISLSVNAGEIVGLVGDSGSGKSTTAFGLLRMAKFPGRILGGSVLLEGRDLMTVDEKELRTIRGKDIAIIVQSPRAALNPLLPVGTQLANMFSAHQRVSRKAALQMAIHALEEVGIADPKRRLTAYPHELSGGMAQRVVIALALSGRPKVLVADDPTTGVDVTIQAQILDKVWELATTTGSATLLVTRDLGIIANYCQRVYIMYAGRIVEQADVKTFFLAPRHPYVTGMHQFLKGERGIGVRSGLVDLKALPPGCAYHPFCNVCESKCQMVEPELVEVEPNHFVRCHRVLSGLEG